MSLNSSILFSHQLHFQLCPQTHYVDLWCGTPPQRQTVIVDTGSPVTAFPCSQCLNCGVPNHHIDTLFYEQCSSTFTKLGCSDCLFGDCNGWFHKDRCNIVVRYAEWSSWHAYEVQDSCYIGGLHTKGLDTDGTPDTSPVDPLHAAAVRVDLKFGCQTRVSGLFQTQLADGIMGMDQARSSLWKQMYNAKTISSQAFSLCFSRSGHASNKGTESGAMSLGGSNPALHKTPMVYATSSRGRGYFRVQVRKVYLREGNSGDSAANPKLAKVVEIGGADEYKIDSKTVIVDSGSTDTYFYSKFGPYFEAAFEKMTGTKYTNRLQKLTQEQVDAMPTILFQLYGDIARNKAVIKGNKSTGTVTGLSGVWDHDHPYDVILAVPPSHYFEYDGKNDRYAARFFTNGHSMSVLGANAIMGHDVLFDGDHGVIGWSESDCDYTKLTKEVYPKKVPEEVEYPTCLVDAIAHTRIPICVSWQCQLFVTALMVFGVYHLCKRVRKIRAGAVDNEEEYEKLAASELEMQTPPSALAADSPYDENDDGLGGSGSYDDGIGIHVAGSESEGSVEGVLS